MTLTAFKTPKRKRFMEIVITSPLVKYESIFIGDEKFTSEQAYFDNYLASIS